MYSSNLSEKVKSAPISPGCYIWKDLEGGVLYVGKAVNIRARTSSYLNNYERLDPKIRSMIDHAQDVEFYEVDSEVEALILETNLIKKYKPKYNRLMKDDKNYVWLKVDWYRQYPRLEIVREQLDKKSEYYGPYPIKFPVTKVLNALRKIYPYCDTPPQGEGRFLPKPCFNYHIGLCSGVCADKVSRIDHRKNINGIRNFFRGRKGREVDKLKQNMIFYSQRKNFEKAAEFRDKLKDLEYVTQRIRITKDMDELMLLKEKEDSSILAQKELIQNLTNYRAIEDKSEKLRIECFDISNIQGTNAVGSMVVFVGGKPAKSEYRKFKIKTKSTPDDFAMMQEVLTRRINRIAKSNWAVPDLIIVDGGKGQLSTVFSLFQKLNYVDKIPLVGLAKREEEIFFVSDDSRGELEFGRILLPRRSQSLYLVQRIRDEAHRFAIGFHRRLRSKGLVHSVLDDIPGVGKIVKQKLFDAFGSVDKMSKQSLEDINSVIRNKRTAGSVWKILQSQ